MLKVSDLREMTAEELRQKKADIAEEVFNLNMRKSVKALDNPLRLRTARREMARIDTILHEDQKGIRKLAEATTSILPQADTDKKEKAEEE
ncbi:MAG: 50S ribosomal protein L29 [candidate division Zixibacteria bacterium]|nr:50S ribosomal protein L29 [candidate division Zixibacteria bacterium]MDH3937964.1 50S ribosomal protein L29 [candidate division Zixibacteria bacterium]MDH4034234.1 50S ribosomal protein L29 [candidate division Zixibacteria bacterium]